MPNQEGENHENGSKAAKRQKHLKVEVGNNVQYCSDVKQNNRREMTTRFDKTASGDSDKSQNRVL